MIPTQEILQERPINGPNQPNFLPHLSKHEEESLQKMKKLKKAQNHKNQVSNQLKITLKSLTNEIKSIDDQRYQKIFKSWIDENGVSNYFLKLIEKDRSSWNRVNENRGRENGDIEKFHLNSLIRQKYDSNTNKQNCDYLNNNQNIALGFATQEGLIVEKKKEQSKSKMMEREENEEGEKQIPFKKRGPYKNYSEELKKQVVDLYLKGTLSLNKINKKYNIPIKNIKRWAENGIYRKTGAGRKKLDPEMEEIVHQRIISEIPEGSLLKESTIREWALEECRVGGFKASRGWINKFVERYKLGEKYLIR